MHQGKVVSLNLWETAKMEIESNNRTSNSVFIIILCINLFFWYISVSIKRF